MADSTGLQQEFPLLSDTCSAKVSSCDILRQKWTKLEEGAVSSARHFPPRSAHQQQKLRQGFGTLRVCQGFHDPQELNSRRGGRNSMEGDLRNRSQFSVPRKSPRSLLLKPPSRRFGMPEGSQANGDDSTTIRSQCAIAFVGGISVIPVVLPGWTWSLSCAVRDGRSRGSSRAFCTRILCLRGSYRGISLRISCLRSAQGRCPEKILLFHLSISKMFSQPPASGRKYSLSSLR